ncbi:esterase-like activity of phytase family protein [Antarctobacter sp.]|uniref:esterase-like activity of phytase family protein n=1 Tax=Antarctobacter sp. TaxID=1872577 RepID=UPI003A93DDC4
MFRTLLKRLQRRLVACLSLGLLAGCTFGSGPKAEFMGRIDWPASMHRLGGFSGLEVTDDGTRFVALSDRSRIVTGQFIRKGGRLVGVENAPAVRLRTERSRFLSRALNDAEGLALSASNVTYISFEGTHRVWAYKDYGTAIPLPRPEAFSLMAGNAGFEALAIDAQDRLYTLPERSGQLTRPFPVWRYDGTDWAQVFTLPRRGGFLPVGADFGPDGRFYLLERGFSGIAFRTRVRRFTLSDDRIVREEVLIETPAHRHGNLEGLSVWRDAAGALRLTMVSDDNFMSFQRSEFVEYRVTE